MDCFKKASGAIWYTVQMEKIYKTTQANPAEDSLYCPFGDTFVIHSMYENTDSTLQIATGNPSCPQPSWSATTPWRTN